MPDVDTDNARRGRRSLTVLFWTGVAIAPLAGLILLLSGGETATRIAAALAVLAVVLIGLSIFLRPDAGEVRGAVEDMVLDEIEMLREDVREDISSAARQTHQSVAERVQLLQQTIDGLRAELEAVRSSGAMVAPANQPVPPAYPPGQPHAPGQAYALGHAYVRPEPAVAAAAPVPPAGRAPAEPSGGTERSRPAAGRAHVPTGVVRHTETVHHVTTRSTFVGHHGDQEDRDAPYGSGYGSRQAEPSGAHQGWAVPSPRRHSDEPEEESWTDQKLRERYGHGSLDSDRAALDDADPRTGGAGARHRWTDHGDSGIPSGEALGGGVEPSRWGSRHADDRGEELRLGERRAAIRSNESGTEMRIEDRWAAVRRGWDRDVPPAEGRRGWDSDAPVPEGRRHEPDAGRRERRALPAAREAPSWNVDWEEPEREPRGRRHRSDDEDYGYSPGQRRFDFEPSDERWR